MKVASDLADTRRHWSRECGSRCINVSSLLYCNSYLSRGTYKRITIYAYLGSRLNPSLLAPHVFGRAARRTRLPGIDKIYFCSSASSFSRRARARPALSIYIYEREHKLSSYGECGNGRLCEIGKVTRRGKGEERGAFWVSRDRARARALYGV